MIPDTQENNAPSPSDKPDALSRIREWLTIVPLTARLFKRHRCMMQASALSYITLVSIVPVTALLLGVSRGCGLDAEFQRNLTRCFIGQEQIAQQILSFADNALKAAHGDMINGFGVLVLLFTAISVQIKIDRCFQDIWNIRTARQHRTFSQSWGQFVHDPFHYTRWDRLARILLLFLLSPVFALIFIGISGQGIAWLEAIPQIPGKHGLITVFRCVFVPLLFAWAAFGFFYLFFIPSPGCGQDRQTNQIDGLTLKLIPPLIACFPTGILFLSGQYVCMYLQRILTNYNATYGRFAAIPFFLIWIQLSWCIVLLGGLIAYMVQKEIRPKKDINTGNEHSQSAGTEQPRPDNQEENTPQAPLSSHYRAVCALRIMKLLGDAYFNSDGKDNRAVSAETISKKLSIPRPDTIVMLNDLRSAELVYFWIPLDTGGFNPNVLQEKDFSECFAKIEDKYKYDPAGCTPTEVLKRLSKTGENRSAKQETSAPDAKGPADSGRQDIPGASPAHEEGTPPEAGTDSEKPDADPGVMSVEEAETILNSLWDNAAERGPGNTPLFSKKTEEETTSDNPDGEPHASDSGQKSGFFGRIGRIYKWIRSRME